MARTNKDLSNDVYAYEEDLNLFYKLRPNLQITVPFYDLSGMHLEASFPSWSIITDQDGHRVAGSRANSVSPRSGASLKKIAFMGGSSIFGWGTDYENTCAHQLEILIKDEYPEGRFRFVNYAVPGYAMSQHLRLLRKIIARKDFPKLILLDATSNCDVPSSATDKERERIRLRPQNRLRFYLGSFRFFQLLEMMIQDLDSSDTDRGGSLLREPIPDYVNYLEEFIELVEEKNGKMIMIGICAGEGYVKQMISVAQTSRVPYISFGDVVKQYAGDSSKSPFGEHEGEIYRIVYRKDILERDPSLYLLFPDRCHPTPIGHRALASALLRIIDHEGLLN